MRGYEKALILLRCFRGLDDHDRVWEKIIACLRTNIDDFLTYTFVVVGLHI